MLAVLYLPSGVFFKPRDIEFDPHARVGHVLIDHGMDEIIKYRKFLCRCYMNDRVYTEREIFITSVYPRSGIALFRFEDFIPDPSRYFDERDVLKISKVIDIADVVERMNELIERSQMGLEVDFSRWLDENVPRGYRKAMSRFAFSYYRYSENFSSIEELKEKEPLVAFALSEIAESARRNEV